MSTIDDVAALAGVSKATASRALSGNGYVSAATRERVAAAARELSYVAHSSATSLATGRTQTVAVIIPGIHRWFFSELLGGIQEALFTADLDLVLYDVGEKSTPRDRLFAQTLPRRHFDGIIAVNLQPRAHELESLGRLHRPLVSVGPYHPGSSAVVAIDDEAAARIATEHLLDLGHKEIVFLGGDRDAATRTFDDQRRLDGYRSAMVAAGLADKIHHAYGDPTMPGGYEAAVRVLGDRRRRPTAFVGVCDEAVIGGIIAARRLGIAVPAELSAIGIDDHQHAEMFSLTTIRQSPREQGEEAVRLLLARIADPDAAEERIIHSAELVVRSSTAAPRAMPPALR